MRKSVIFPLFIGSKLSPQEPPRAPLSCQINNSIIINAEYRIGTESVEIKWVVLVRRYVCCCWKMKSSRLELYTNWPFSPDPSHLQFSPPSAPPTPNLLHHSFPSPIQYPPPHYYRCQPQPNRENTISNIIIIVSNHNKQKCKIHLQAANALIN